MALKPWIAQLIAHAERGDTFHLVDTETTGSSAHSHRVIELATVSVRDGAIVGRFETLIDPGVSVPSFITQLTGISTPMLRGAPAPLEAWRAWHRYLVEAHGPTAAHFVAHNAPFDWGFMQAEYARLERHWPFSTRYCTVQLARHCLPALPSRSLESLIRHFGLQVDARHRALADAEATAEVFIKLLAQLRQGAALTP